MSPTPGSSNIQGLSTMNNIMIPTKYFLYPNYPNPFNPVTRFTYDLPMQSQVKISIFNTLGHEIKTLVNSKQNNGSYAIQWDGSDNHGNRVSSGVYLYHLNANSFNQTIKHFKNHKECVLIFIRDTNLKSVSQTLRDYKSRKFYNKGKDKLIKNYGIGAQIIKALNIKNMILVTRSKKKVVGLDGYGIKITKQEIIK